MFRLKIEKNLFDSDKPGHFMKNQKYTIIKEELVNFKDLKPISDEDLEELRLAGEALKNDKEWNEEFNKDMENELKLQSREDIAGQTIKVGDYIVYSSLFCQRTVLNFAKIVGLGTKKDPQANNIKVVAVYYKFDFSKEYNPKTEWSKQWLLRNHGKCVSIRIDQNVLLINENQIPNNAFQLLLCASTALKPE